METPSMKAPWKATKCSHGFVIYRKFSILWCLIGVHDYNLRTITRGNLCSGCRKPEQRTA